MVTVLSLLYPKVHSRQNVSGKDGYCDRNSDGCCVTRNAPDKIIQSDKQVNKLTYIHTYLQNLKKNSRAYYTICFVLKY